LSTDGNILAFRKDGSTVGSIGVEGGDLVIGTGDTGVQFNDGGDLIRPFNISTNSPRDNAVDLGLSTTRFKDLFLSGGVYLGGTGAANKLDDYEEGTWTPTLNAYGGTPTIEDATYTKIGRKVFASANITLDGTSDSSTFKINDLPFTSQNTSADLYGSIITYHNSGVSGFTFAVQNAAASVIGYESNGTTLTYNDFGASKNLRLTMVYSTD